LTATESAVAAGSGSGAGKAARRVCTSASRFSAVSLVEVFDFNATICSKLVFSVASFLVVT
jgi:hypothetical protein